MSRLRLLLLYLRQQSRPFPPPRLGCSRLPTMLCFWFTAPAVCSLANEFDEVSRHVVIEIIKRIRKKIIGRSSKKSAGWRIVQRMYGTV